MTANDGWTLETSPFHAGEIAAQERVGVAERMARFGRMVVRPYLNDQLREFFADLTHVFVGHVDADGRPWASVLAGGSGFMRSPDDRTLVIETVATPGDPLSEALVEGAAIGLVGIGLGNRRRNRVNGHLVKVEPGRVTLRVDQAFGNCPQYIRPRDSDRVVPARDDTPPPERFSGIDARARAQIELAESFFVASSSRNDDPAARTNGADISHRGGKPGFVRVDGDILTIPDFAGNLHFNTLGNFLIEPRAGLLFVDWKSGAAVMLTGTVEIIWDGAEIEAFRGAERLWRFRSEAGIHLAQVVAPEWEEGEISPNSLMTGDWEEAAATLAAEGKRKAWRPYRVVRVEDESILIRSFYLEPADAAGLFRYRPGQHVTIRVPAGACGSDVSRTYTLSSAPSDRHYRISIKREDARADAPAGLVSNWLHSNLRPGDLIEARAPSGAFFIETTQRRPAVLIAAGVGVTPMISMAREVAHEGIRTRHTRPLTIIHAARSAAERAFAGAFRALSRETQGKVRYVSVLKRVENGDDFDAEGRIDASMLRSLLALDDYDVFLCGPPKFIQSIYADLRSLGVRDRRIFAEAFGPSTLERIPDSGIDKAASASTVTPEADEAIVAFAASRFEQRWSAGDPTILELAERHGLQPQYGCRNGTCGSCSARLLSGEVTYRTKPSFAAAGNDVLICCAVPASGSARIEIEL